MSRVVIPTSTDWLDTADYDNGTVMVGGRLAEILHPQLWDGRAAAWSHALDQYAWDYSGKGSHAARVGGVSDAVDAWDFDGVSGFLDNGERLDQTTNDFTLSAWVEHTGDASQANAIVINKRNNGAGPGNPGFTWFLEDDAGDNTQQLVLDDGTVATGNSNTDVPLNEWHHVGVTVDRDGNATFYLDGVADGSFSVAANTASLANGIDFRVGATEDGSDYFTGRMADVRVYDVLAPATTMQLLASRRNIAYLCRLQPRRFFFR